MAKKIGLKYAYSAGQIEKLLSCMKDKSRPNSLTFQYIRDNWLLANAQYSASLDIVADMGFIDSSNKPTDLYAKFQNLNTTKEALSEGIKNAYPDLFKVHPNAFNEGAPFLKGYFKQNSGADSSVVDKIYTTFNKLCSMADFQDRKDININGGHLNNTPHEKPAPNVQTSQNQTFPFPVTMNIQLVLPSDASAEQYDKIFMSMKKLFSSDK